MGARKIAGINPLSGLPQGRRADPTASLAGVVAPFALRHSRACSAGRRPAAPTWRVGRPMPCPLRNRCRQRTRAGPPGSPADESERATGWAAAASPAALHHGTRRLALAAPAAARSSPSGMIAPAVGIVLELRSRCRREPSQPRRPAPLARAIDPWQVNGMAAPAPATPRR